MWVVKLGGSLQRDPVLPQWLELLAGAGAGRVAIVGGGGSLADQVRCLQAHWRFDDLAAHNMAVLSMAQSGYQFQAMNPALRLVSRSADIAPALAGGRAVVWLPFELQSAVPGERTNWDATSDTIALDLARALNAERLVLVKSCRVDASCGLVESSAKGVVDAGFARIARGVGFPIALLGKDDLGAMRELLSGMGAARAKGASAEGCRRCRPSSRATGSNSRPSDPSRARNP